MSDGAGHDDGTAWGGKSAGGGKPAGRQRQRFAGIADVAALAGVSPATVSRALGSHTGVAAPTRAKVEDAARELGYVPSAFAAALARRSSHSIGVVTPWASRWFFATVIEGVHDVVAEHGYDLLLYPVGPDRGEDAEHFEKLGLHKRVDGVIGLAMPYQLRRSRSMQHVPILTVGTSTPGIPGVQVDDVEVGSLATRHLIDLGHRRIAFVGLDPQDVYGFRVADDRYHGYLSALADAAIEPDPAWVVTTGFEAEAGEAALVELLMRCDWRRENLPTAIVAVSDEVAMGVIYAAREWGIRVPDQLSIVGVDNHELARLFDLTTVSQPVTEQGRIATTLLLDMIRTGGTPDPLMQRLDPGLIVRNTTARPRPRPQV